jgi:hypothetical protein
MSLRSLGAPRTSRDVPPGCPSMRHASLASALPPAGWPPRGSPPTGCRAGVAAGGCAAGEGRSVGAPGCTSQRIRGGPGTRMDTRVRTQTSEVRPIGGPWGRSFRRGEPGAMRSVPPSSDTWLYSRPSRRGRRAPLGGLSFLGIDGAQRDFRAALARHRAPSCRTQRCTGPLHEAESDAQIRTGTSAWRDLRGSDVLPEGSGSDAEQSGQPSSDSRVRSPDRRSPDRRSPDG